MKSISKDELLGKFSDHNLEIYVYDNISSTNDKAKQLLDKAPCLVAAKTQSSGKGQQGKSFFSPEGGIYMSLCVKPDIEPESLAFITLMSGMAVRDAVEKICEISCKLKYVNDLLIEGKKVCGILTEAVFEGEKLKGVVIGIGINCENTPLPKELDGVITSLEKECGKQIDKNALIAEIVKNLFSGLKNFSAETVKEEYERVSGIKTGF